MDFEWRIKNGNSILFLEDNWTQGQPLMFKFPKLYQISKWKQIEVSMFKDLWDCYDHEGSDFWLRPLRNWELELTVELNLIILSIKFNNKDDLLIWKPGKEAYSISNGLSFLNKSGEEESVMWSFIWDFKVPPKVMLFLWKFH